MSLAGLVLTQTLEVRRAEHGSGELSNFSQEA